MNTRKMIKNNIKIGSRGSKLALWQANWVKGQIEKNNPGLEIEIVTIKTQGDKILDVPLAKVGGKGLFVKEIEEALQNKTVDLAVHSMKDVPAELPEDLTISAISEREDYHDVLLSQDNMKLNELPPGAVIGTSSLRRQAQLLHYRPDLRVTTLRGNLDTRIRRIRQGDFQAIVVARAGVNRLGLESEIAQVIPVEIMLSAVGQGALGIEIRKEDEFIRAIIKPIDHFDTHTALIAERAFLKRLEGGCQVPIAGIGKVRGKELKLEGLVASPDGTKLIRDSLEGSIDAAEEIGLSLAEKLLALGAGDILAAANHL